jgi:hypothetical protein
MNKSGILVRSLQASQFCVSLSSSVNKIISEVSDLDVIVFYEAWAQLIVPPKFGMLMDREMLGLDGVCIATDLKSAHKLLRSAGPKKKYFYVWNLEWIGNPSIRFKDMHDIYCNDQISLIARSQYHYDILAKTWKKPVAIMNNFSPDILKDVLYGKL